MSTPEERRFFWLLYVDGLYAGCSVSEAEAQARNDAAKEDGIAQTVRHWWTLEQLEQNLGAHKDFVALLWNRAETTYDLCPK